MSVEKNDQIQKNTACSSENTTPSGSPPADDSADVKNRRRDMLRLGASAFAALTILPLASGCQTERPSLVLSQPKLRENMTALFKRMEENKHLQQTFINNPMKLLYTEVLKQDAPALQTSEVNKLLFSFLSNKKFLHWMDEYAVRNKGKDIEMERYSRDFADAVVKYGDANIVGSLARLSSLAIKVPGLGGVAQQIIVNNPAGQTAATPVCTPAPCGSSNSGFGFGGIDPVVNPAFIRSITEQLIRHANALAAAGKLSAM